MAPAARKRNSLRKQEEKQDTAGGFGRWLPSLFSSLLPSSSSTSATSPAPLNTSMVPKRDQTSKSPASGSVTRALEKVKRSSWRTPVSVLARLREKMRRSSWPKSMSLWDRRYTLSLLVLTLAVAVYFMMDRDVAEPPSKYSLSLSGPGLSSAFTLPMRYLYVTVTPLAPDTIAAKRSSPAFSLFPILKKVAHSLASLAGFRPKTAPLRLDPGEWRVTWRWKPSSPLVLRGRRVAYSSVVDRGGGDSILRFRLLQSVPEGYALEATISHSGQVLAARGEDTPSSAKHISVKPATFILKGPAYVPSTCSCPSEDGNEPWLEALKCPASFSQLDEDMSSLPLVDLHRLREESRKLVGPESLRTLVHYVVKNNRLYRRSLGPLPGFQYFSDAVLLYLTSVAKLPDVEFILNLGDWPTLQRQPGIDPLPLFGWSSGSNHADIILPQWDVLKTTLFPLDSNKSDDLLTLQENTNRPLEERIPKALFRGRDSNPIRVGVVRLARKYPSLIDAGITSWEKEENAAAETALGGAKSRIPLREFANYKYQLLLDGTVAAYRTPYLLHSGSVPLKHESEYYEWFYKDLQPMVHYLPFKTDLSDLIKRLRWAEAHPHKAAAIAQNAQKYARENLMPEKILCYYYRALTAYAKRQNTEPRVEADMLRVEPEPNDAGCTCSSHAKTTEKDDYPIVAVDYKNVREILQKTKQGIVLVAFSSFSNASGRYMPKFLQAARLFSAKEAPVMFAASDGYRYSYPAAYKFCGYPGEQPKVMFLPPMETEAEKGPAAGGNSTRERKPEYLQEPLTLFNTVNFVNKHLPEKYQVTVAEDFPDIMSQAIPTDNDKKLVKTVVGANFDDLVLDSKKDVLLFVHAPWCGFCKRFRATYEAFAKEAAESSSLADTLAVTRMDGSENRLRHKEFSWTSYPVLWLVSGNNAAQRKRPTQFTGPWTVAGLRDFVMKQRHTDTKSEEKK